MRTQQSPGSNGGQDSPAIPIPLPVYVRTRDVNSADNSSKPKKCRRSRTVFTGEQSKKMRIVFLHMPVLKRPHYHIVLTFDHRKSYKAY